MTVEESPKIPKEPLAEDELFGAELRKIAVELGLFDLDLDADPAILDRFSEILERLPNTASKQVINALSTAKKQPEHTSGAFIEKHGISKAEGKLLASLAEGQSVVQHAESLDISVNTARTHMRRLLEKTGASGQLDLLRLYFSLSGPS